MILDRDRKSGEEERGPTVKIEGDARLVPRDQSANTEPKGRRSFSQNCWHKGHRGVALFSILGLVLFFLLCIAYVYNLRNTEHPLSRSANSFPRFVAFDR